uniref:PX domain-containing protein n=1 Tax=Odontella aurita TaxID=265563 RepID=A0A7S4JK44_9STRA|mmetsp:Transcript_47375/g.143427  ORF Transcript_47375/g.143427 Transcript_47375/m.143427 type:complete len:523 (+) Transcript_47375:245-1813(+)|eukprot:CAMPEP_0113544492 /NCGR_PEP_ID=MMETSP0015_2-20120614/10740_1 /TAXON_ID=2838 /ORGANISM="Odontella" /LENGTH=522 /DNA_ID=CAMNT_0000444761 /DNA_START=207 /DNA_END=1775 /DNA_ORIENTATION=- /assembly_acc=CAM_ASM_000160
MIGAQDGLEAGDADLLRYSSRSESGLVDEPLDDGGVDETKSPSLAADPNMHTVEVFDPQQHGKGRKRYTSYCILVRDIHADQSRAAVRRRYSAFQWLYRHLNEERPGAFVPILSHRKALGSAGRFSDDLISFRRDRGEVWLNRIIRHPELRDSPCLVQFLGAEDSLFAADRERESEEDDVKVGDASSDSGDGVAEDNGNHGQDEEAASRREGSDDRSETAVSVASEDEDASGKVGVERFHQIKKLANKFSTRMALSSGASELEKSPDEDCFDQMGEWIGVANSTIRSLSQETLTLRELYRERKMALEAAGSRLAAAGGMEYPLCSEVESGLITAVMKTAGETSSNMALVEGERVDLFKDTFDRLFKELLRDVQSFRAGLQKRRDVQMEYSKQVHRIQTEKESLEVIQAYPTNRAVNNAQQEKSVKGAEKQLKEAKDQAVAGKAKFEECCERVKREAERFRVDFRDKLCELVRTLANTEMEYNSKAGEGWREVQGSMEYMEVSSVRGGEEGDIARLGERTGSF